jgi:GTP pyrophosphokinase
MVTMEQIEERYAQLEALVCSYNPGADLKRLRAAFDYAAASHSKQLRTDGSPYVSHPLATAEIVAEMGLDEDSLIAALLHDCIEDTGATHEDVARMFGEDVADIVEGVTKLTRVVYTNKEEEQMENMRKMLMAMARDIRVILIKIADRLHNMRTMEYQTPEKQSEKALETMEIYAPIAHRLGMQKIKWELEDLSIFYLDPIGYAKIEEELDKRQAEDETFFTTVKEKIEQHLKANHIECTVYGRIKHIYSIYRKMYSQNKEFSEVLDLYAFRVIVDDIAECYNAFGLIHELFRPIPAKIKDYISTPKPNGYQSLHTTVLGSEGIPFEVQIRTKEMHLVSEYGVAAHWKYKQGVTKKTSDEEKFAWVRRLLESQQDSDAQDFMSALRVDMFADEVFVFTPRSDVISLPAGATPIDFAYNIHSAIGNRMTSAIVNGRIVPFNHTLQNGDIVEVITSNASKGPSRDWLNIVKSPEARNKIRQWFKKEKRDENIVHGKVSFESELKHNNLSLSDVTRDEVLPKVLKKLGFASLDELYAAIGYGGLSSQKAVNRIRDDLSLAARARKKEESDFTIDGPKTGKKQKPVHGVMVEGLDNCLVKFARCCAPVPGDPIVGFITRGYGVSVHRGDCPNYIKSRGNPDEAGRWVSVSWSDTLDDSYSTALSITSKERSGVVMDITTALNAMKVRLSALQARDIGGTTSVSIVLDVKNLEDLSAAIARIASIQGITEVRRTDG